jgi:hypothetical protein
VPVAGPADSPDKIAAYVVGSAGLNTRTAHAKFLALLEELIQMPTRMTRQRPSLSHTSMPRPVRGALAAATA